MTTNLEPDWMVEDQLRDLSDKRPLSEVTELSEPSPWAKTISGAELDAMKFPPMRHLVFPILPVGGIVVLSGLPKAGKSFLAYGLAVGVAGGGDALGNLPVQETGPVLVVSLDDQSPGRAQRRIRDLTKGEAIPGDLHLHLEPNVGNNHEFAANLNLYMEHNPKTRLVVLDVMESFRNRDKSTGSAYADDSKFMSRLRAVAGKWPDCTFLILTHSRKGDKQNPDDAIAAVGGTGGITGGTDAIMSLTGARGEPMRVLDVVSRDGADSRHALRFTEHGLVWDEGHDPNDPALTLGGQSKRVYLLAVEFPHGITGATVKEHFPDISDPAGVFKRLSDSGHVRKLERGVYVATTRSDTSATSDREGLSE